MPCLLPIIIRIEEPIFLLVSFWMRIEECNRYEVSDNWIGTIFVSTLLFRNLLMLTITNGPNPSRRCVVDDLFPRETAALKFAGVRQAYDLFGGRHDSLDQFSLNRNRRFLLLRQTQNLGPALDERIVGERFRRAFLSLAQRVEAVTKFTRRFRFRSEFCH